MKYFLIGSICLLAFSCKKTKRDIIWECDSAQFSDSTVISNKIAGSWLWTKQICWGNGKIFFANKNVKVNFNANRTFTVVENGSIITLGNWNLEIVDGNAWGLNLSVSSEYLYGRILFCNNQVMFNDSYIDGCDNVFAKE
jgi:hypothetical protein